MSKAVFYHKADSPYDDQPDRYYHFPRQYLDRVNATIGDNIVYYGPVTDLSGRYYTATARVVAVRHDIVRQNHFYADVDSYQSFDRPVEYRENGGFERALVSPTGKISGGAAVNAVRHISFAEFQQIIEAGLGSTEEWPDRDAPDRIAEPTGLAEEGPLFIDRPIVEQLLSRSFRDRKFKQHVRTAYNRTCAFTGLRLINGQGRPEVEAAHIIPVEENGSDSVRNGIALSGTVHWMFDRGFLSLSDSHDILVSRHMNSDVSHLLAKDRKAILPKEPWLQPHPVCLRWHRESRFKA